MAQDAFMAPGAYDAEAEQIRRRMAFAQALQDQSRKLPGGQMIGRHFVPMNPMEGIASMAEAYYGRKAQDQAMADMQKLSDDRRAESMNTLQKYADLLTGKPAKTIQPDPQEVEQAFDTEGQAVPQPFTVPAQAPNKQAALAVLLQSRDPMLQQMGTKAMLEKEKYGQTPHYDQNGRAYVLGETGVPKFLDGVTARDKMEVAPNGQAYNPYQIRPGQVFADPNKPFSVGADGPVPNLPLQAYEIKKAEKGAAKTDVRVSTEKGFLGQVADAVGKNVGATADQAKGAVGTINTVNQIRDAIDGGKVTVGPGATARNYMAQVGQLIGVGGKDAQEQLVNTRKTIQGLAQLELDGASQLKGQGQITEGERDIVRRAASGNIDNLTLPEMRSLMDVLDKAARLKIAANSDNIKRLRSNPGAAPVVDFMDVPMPPAYTPRGPAATPSGGALKQNADGSFTYTPAR